MRWVGRVGGGGGGGIVDGVVGEWEGGGGGGWGGGCTAWGLAMLLMAIAVESSVTHVPRAVGSVATALVWIKVHPNHVLNGNGADSPSLRRCTSTSTSAGGASRAGTPGQPTTNGLTSHRMVPPHLSKPRDRTGGR